MSRINKIEEFLDCDVNIVFVRLLKARLKINFDFYKSTNNIEEFRNMVFQKCVMIC